ncbi:MAG TPA: DJ-1/PfpI family protein, partial [Acidimicrobiales bacterium]
LAARDGGEAPFEVVTLSPDGGPVTAYGGLGLQPQAAVADGGSFDAVVVPGTIDLDAATGDERLLAAVRSLAGAAGITTSVCTGAFLLGATGLLEGRRWTTHWEDVDLLASRVGAAGAVRGVRWVDAGDVVTAAGLSSGIAMALHLVDRLAGRSLAERTARQLDYDWHPDAGEPVAAAPGAGAGATG